MSDIVNARFFIAMCGLIIGTAFSMLGLYHENEYMMAEGTALISGIVGYFMGRRTHRSASESS